MFWISSYFNWQVASWYFLWVILLNWLYQVHILETTPLHGDSLAITAGQQLGLVVLVDSGFKFGRSNTLPILCEKAFYCFTWRKKFLMPFRLKCTVYELCVTYLASTSSQSSTEGFSATNMFGVKHKHLLD